MIEDYDDNFEDFDEEEDEDAHLSIVALALREARPYERLRKSEPGRSGRASRNVMVDGVECSASVSVAVDRPMTGFVHVEITYQEISGVAHFQNIEGWPSEYDCWDAWDVAVENLAERSEAFRRDCKSNPEQHKPVSHD